MWSLNVFLPVPTPGKGVSFPRHPRQKSAVALGRHLGPTLHPSSPQSSSRLYSNFRPHQLLLELALPPLAAQPLHAHPHTAA